MVTLKDFDESKLDKFSVEDLNTFINEIEMKKSITREKMAMEMSEKLKDDRFDIYSFWGKRKIKAITKKYYGILAGADIYISIIKRELARREVIESAPSYSGRSIAKKKEMTEEEFLQKEQDKTWAYRSKIE